MHIFQYIEIIGNSLKGCDKQKVKSLEFPYLPSDITWEKS